ncbi:hypothetical protein [Actinospica robiniae]|uniref:hypothetical protein n=1 Tax=Actinospica robiniae TaxID=304901 RepID=UPI00042A826B|nr:hypothetical protein [Actinospica robiniae]
MSTSSADRTVGTPDVVTTERISAALDEIERAAREIAEDSGERLKKLSLLAECVAPSDPGRAAALWDESEQAALSLADEGARATCLAGIARSACRHDAERAERIALQMLAFGWTGPSGYTGLLATFAGQPDGVARAARIVAGIADSAAREEILQDAMHDPQGFGVREVLVDFMPPGEARTQWLRQIAEAKLWSSPQPLATLLSRPGIATDPAGRLHDLGMIAFGMADRRDPELSQALELLDQAIDAVGDADARSAALDEPVFRLAGVAPEAAARLLPHLRDPHSICAVSQVLAETLAPLDPDRAEQIALGIDYDAAQRDYALAELAGGLACFDPDRAEMIVARIADPEMRIDGVVRVATALVGIDPDRAQRLVAGIDDVAVRDDALSGLLWRCARQDLKRGLQIAESISDPEKTDFALEDVASYLAETDAAAAEQVIAMLSKPERADWARCLCVDDLALTDPSAAERFAAAVSDPAIRAEAWLRLVRVWLEERGRATA